MRYIKSVYILVIFFSNFLRLDSFSQAPVFQWGGGIGGNATDVASDITTDANGNSYTTGPFWNTPDFDPGAGVFNITGLGNGDIYITKLDINGNFVWAKAIGGTLMQNSTSIKTDAAGNIILTGFFHGTTDFDPGTGVYNFTAATNVYNAFVLKLDPNGNFIWAKQIGTGIIGMTTSYDLALDATGNIFIVGQYDMTQDFDPGAGTFIMNGTTAGSIDGYLLKLDANGNFVWVQYVPGWCMSVESGLAGDIYVGGGFIAPSDFDQGQGVFILTPTYNNTFGSSGDGFVLKLNSAGNFVWVKQLSGSNRSQVNHVRLDCEDNVYVGGEFFTSIDLDPGPAISTFTTPTTMSSCYIAKLSAAGNFVWGMPVRAWLGNFDLDRFGDVYITGIFEIPTDFDPGPATYTLAPVGPTDAFISKYSTTGNFSWAYRLGAGSFDTGESIKLDSLDNIYLTGTFTHTVDLNPLSGVSNVASHGPLEDVFVIKLSQNLVQNLTSPSNQSFCSSGIATLNVIGEGPIHWYTSPTSTNSIASGTSFVTPSLSTTTTYFVERKSCEPGPRLAVTITVNPLPTLNATSSKTLVCAGNSATLSASGASTYTWTNLILNPAIITPTATKVYTVTGTDANNCVNTATVMVIFSNYQVKTLFNYPKACAKTETVISPVKQIGFDNGGSFSSGDLSVDGSNGQINLNTLGQGTYVVNYSVTTQGCDGSGSDTLKIVDPDLNISPAQTIPVGSSITLTVSGADSYSWSPEINLSCASCTNPIAKPLEATLYCVNAELNSCPAKACVLVNVTCETNNDFSVPNAFTPNGDGHNDSFCLQGWSTCVTDFLVIIFNRWGEKVFESSNPDFCWDGSHKGAALNSDVFIYAIKASFKQQANVSRKGNISLIR